MPKHPKDLLIALFWLALLGLAVVSSGAVLDKVRDSVNRAL